MRSTYISPPLPPPLPPCRSASPCASPDMPLLEHALQCAEACRAAFPDEEWMHLAALLAPLGKLMAHAK